MHSHGIVEPLSQILSSANNQAKWVPAHKSTKYWDIRQESNRWTKIKQQRVNINKCINKYKSWGHLVDMSPVFSAVIESFPHHAHDLSKCNHIEGQVSNFWHKRRGWPPWIVWCGLTDLHSSTTCSFVSRNAAAVQTIGCDYRLQVPSSWYCTGTMTQWHI